MKNELYRYTCTCFSTQDHSIETARYAPDYEATVQSFISHLDEHNFTHGVLVQPSFLGTNNQAMLNAIQQYPERLKGIAVVQHTTTFNELVNLKAQRNRWCSLKSIRS